MSEELSAWLDETRAQGDPAHYCKTDLEIWVMRLFDRCPFNAGRSQRDRRRSFEDIWEAAKGNPEAIAYGFDAALKGEVYTMAYVKACVRNWATTSTYVQSKPIAAPPTMGEVAKAMDYKFNMPIVKPDPKPIRRTRKPVQPVIPSKKVEWK